MSKILTVLLFPVSFTALARSRGGSQRHHSTHRHHPDADPASESLRRKW